MISYSREAQEMFSWVLAGKAISALTGRVIAWKGGRDTTAALSESLAHSAACGDIIIDKFFESKIPRFKVLGFIADTAGDINDLCSVGCVKEVVAIAKSLISIFLTFVSAGIYLGVQTYVLPRVSLVLETMAFITKFVHFSNTFNLPCA
ncbi:MAG: hypothetical protein ACRDFB_10070 [Rhabdochlamydiaceae bacterium]